MNGKGGESRGRKRGGRELSETLFFLGLSCEVLKRVVKKKNSNTLRTTAFRREREEEEEEGGREKKRGEEP